MKLGKGFEQFETVKDLVDALKEMTGQYPGKGDAYYFVQGTPFESLWPSKNVSYNGDQYDFIGYGPDRNSPCGPLPRVIVAVRSDLAKLICGDTYEPAKSGCMAGVDFGKDVIRTPLRGPDWKPAPGFEDY